MRPQQSYARCCQGIPTSREEDRAHRSGNRHCTASALLNNYAHAAGPVSPVNVGNWHGGSYTNDSTGLFSHCAVSASYKSGIIFSVAVSKDGSWRFGFINNAWHLTIGQTIPVDLTFNGRGPYHVYARALQPNFVVVEMPSTSETVRLFRNAVQMNAFTSGQLFSFALTDTSVNDTGAYPMRAKQRRFDRVRSLTPCRPLSRGPRLPMTPRTQARHLRSSRRSHGARDKFRAERETGQSKDSQQARHPG